MTDRKRPSTQRSWRLVRWSGYAIVFVALAGILAPAYLPDNEALVRPVMIASFVVVLALVSLRVVLSGLILEREGRVGTGRRRAGR